MVLSGEGWGNAAEQTFDYSMDTRVTRLDVYLAGVRAIELLLCADSNLQLRLNGHTARVEKGEPLLTELNGLGSVQRRVVSEGGNARGVSKRSDLLCRDGARGGEVEVTRGRLMKRKCGRVFRRVRRRQKANLNRNEEEEEEEEEEGEEVEAIAGSRKTGSGLTYNPLALYFPPQHSHPCAACDAVAPVAVCWCGEPQPAQIAPETFQKYQWRIKPQSTHCEDPKPVGLHINPHSRKWICPAMPSAFTSAAYLAWSPHRAWGRPCHLHSL